MLPQFQYVEEPSFSADGLISFPSCRTDPNSSRS